MQHQFYLITMLLGITCIVWLLVKKAAIISNKQRIIRKLAWIGALLAILVILRLTIFRLNGLHITTYNFVLFWSYVRRLQDPDSLDVILQVYLNIELYFPLGLFLYSALRKRQKGWIVVGVALLLSAVAEYTQFVFGTGMCELDDVFHNTLGALIGVGVSFAIDEAISQNKVAPSLRARRVVLGMTPLMLTVLFFVGLEYLSGNIR